MAKTVVVKLTDDLDGSDADETISFGLDGKSFEIDLSTKNAETLRRELEKYIAKARVTTRPTRIRERPGRAARSDVGGPTLFSQLGSEEKDRFRVWANLPTARRIGDARVQAWIDAGRP